MSKRRSKWVRCKNPSCGKGVLTTTPHQKYCCTRCRNAHYHALSKGKGRGDHEYYVYVWKDCGEVFYVGKGVEYRMNSVHYRESKGKASERPLAECEIMKRKSSHFQAEKVTAGMTEQEAYAAEAALIAYLRPKCNKIRPFLAVN